MPNNLVFVCADAAAGEVAAQPYVSRGWTTHVLAANDPLVVDHVCSAQAMVVALEAGGDISPALETACSVQAKQLAEDPLIVFMGADKEGASLAKERLPYALFIKPEELPWILKHLHYRG